MVHDDLPEPVVPRSFLADDGRTYVDDLEHIALTDLLLRRVPWWHIIWDGNEEAWRPSSAAFDNHDGGSPMSIRVRPRLEAMGLSPESVIAHFPDFGLVEFSAGEARAKEQVVAFEAVDEEPAHGVVAGKKTKGVRRHLVRVSAWSMPLSKAAIAKAIEKAGKL